MTTKVAPPKPTEPASNCPAVKAITRDLMPGVLLDKAITKKIGSAPGEEVASGSAVIAAICSADPITAVVCTIPAADLAIVAEHASQCVQKGQCLEITVPLPIPFIAPVAIPWCVGADDGCC